MFFMIIREHGERTGALTVWDEDREEPKAAAIEMWWDRSRREWVLYPVDADGNQLAEAVYDFRKAEALETKKILEAEYGL